MKTGDNKSFLHMGKEWERLLDNYLCSEQFSDLIKYVEERRRTTRVFPSQDKIFRIFRELSPSEVKCVILGQDPYHTFGKADGYAFSVPRGEKLPPSLKNIRKKVMEELERNHGFGKLQFKNLSEALCCFDENDEEASILTPWVRQGVFLLNTALTVEEKVAASHSKIGWEKLTDKVIGILAQDEEPKVFILWGNHAKSKKSIILDEEKQKDMHLIIEGGHPSPLSYRYFKQKDYFIPTNQFLINHGKAPIEWSLPFDIKEEQ